MEYTLTRYKVHDQSSLLLFDSATKLYQKMLVRDIGTKAVITLTIDTTLAVVLREVMDTLVGVGDYEDVHARAISEDIKRQLEHLIHLYKYRSV
jgi:ribosomal protein L17